MRSRELEQLKLTLSLNDLQREVLFGLLLGDGHLETQNGGRTYRLKIEQSAKKEAYLFHLYGLFKEWVTTAPRTRYVGEVQSKNLSFQTISHPAFRFYAHQFYNGRKKKIPSLLSRQLSTRALAYWFMDDGSIKSRQSKGVIFNTQGFQLAEVGKLCEILDEKFKLNCKPRSQSDGIQIYVSGKSYETFVDLISEYVIPEMKYKIPPSRLTRLPKE